jgi:hypothetical protein
VTGFLREVKAAAVEAVQQSFTILYPEPGTAGAFQVPYVSVEYPIRQADYPAVWVDFEVAELRTVGIDYSEMQPDGTTWARWRFTGHVTFTVVALSSNERDLIYDQLVALAAFASQSTSPSQFRQTAESTDLIAAEWSFDKVEDRGQAAAPGTPWMTDEMVYERGFALQLIGEFISDPVTFELVTLAEILVTESPEADPADTEQIAVTS